MLRKTLMAASALALVSTAVPASAATIVLNGVNAISNQGAKNGFIAAANYWGNMLTNNVTISINVAFSSLGAGILGSTGSNRSDFSVSNAYAGLVNNASSTLDAFAVASLTTQLAAGGGNTVNAVVSSVDDLSKSYDTNQSRNNGVLYENTAVQKALGVTGLAGPDASITFSSNFAFDFDPTDGVTAGTYDFVGVAVHEFGHALGFTSGVDYYDIYSCPDGPGCTFLTDADFDGESWMRVLDLFRYSDAGQLDWSVNTPSYFSIDDGATEFLGNSNFSSGSYNGDGWQASHWQGPRSTTNPNNFSCVQPKIGIMNPYSCSGQESEVTASDIGAMDAIGWNTRVDALGNPNYVATSASIFQQFAPAPEPATWLQLILGFGVIGGAYRSARRRKVSFAAA